jgi:2-C-methyl-D-erythritol 4-phosphate cytidylyltransferase
MPPGLVEETRESFAALGLTGVRVIAGGILRSDSTQAAIASLGDRDCDVLLHDAARPLVDARIIADCVRALRAGVAVSAAVPATDTVAVVDDAALVRSMPDRAHLRNLQTPQGFRLSVIREAYRLARADEGGALRATDDCGVVRHYLPDVPIQLVEGSPDNLKVTHPGDLARAEALLRSRSD